MRIRRHPAWFGRTSVALAIAAAALLTGCGRDDAPISATELPARIDDLRPTSLNELDARELAAEAVDPDGLSALLGSAHFEGAIERSYASAGLAIRRVEVLLARFGSGADADRYIAWQREHVGDVIGDAELATERIPGTPIWIHLPDGCCAKEQVIALAAWRRGTDVVRVIVAGPDADGQAGASLIGRLQDAFSPDA